MSVVKGAAGLRLAFARDIPNAKPKQGLAICATQETLKNPLIFQEATVQSLIVLSLSCVSRRGGRYDRGASRRTIFGQVSLPFPRFFDGVHLFVATILKDVEKVGEAGPALGRSMETPGSLAPSGAGEREAVAIGWSARSSGWRIR
jgi:hypothetical protein